jgi:hypothetical protein
VTDTSNALRFGLIMSRDLYRQLCDAARRAEISNAAWLRLAILEKLRRDQ